MSNINSTVKLLPTRLTIRRNLPVKLLTNATVRSNCNLTVNRVLTVNLCFAITVKLAARGHLQLSKSVQRFTLRFVFDSEKDDDHMKVPLTGNPFSECRR
jgi:hypothetical protein